MEIIRNARTGTVIWRGTWKVGILGRCERYMRRTGDRVEIWANKAYLTTLDTPPTPIAAAPTARRGDSIRRGRAS